MVIDYSKWDNIDTDSEPEEQAKAVPRPAPFSTSGPKATAQQKPKASTSVDPKTSPTTTSHVETIKAIICRCDGDPGLKWSNTTIPSSHAIFDLDPAPVPTLLEIPLVFQRLTTHTERTAALDNQMVTFMNINPVTGFAPPEWQQCVGNVLVARKDRKHLLEQHVEGVWMYCDGILDRFGDGEGAPRDMYSRQAFQEYWTGYQKDMTDRDGGQGVKSPYEV